MGNTIGVDVQPPKFHDFIQGVDEPERSPHSDSEVSVTQNEPIYESLLRVWQFSTSKDGLLGSYNPIQCNSNVRFQTDSCYVVLHAFRKEFLTNRREQQNDSKKPAQEEPLAICTSITDSITPRGRSKVFGGFHAPSFRRVKKENILYYDIYVWHGKTAAPMSYSTAVAGASDLERILKNEDMQKQLYELFFIQDQRVICPLKLNPALIPQDDMDCNHIFRVFLKSEEAEKAVPSRVVKKEIRSASSPTVEFVITDRLAKLINSNQSSSEETSEQQESESRADAKPHIPVSVPVVQSGSDSETTEPESESNSTESSSRKSSSTNHPPSSSTRKRRDAGSTKRSSTGIRTRKQSNSSKYRKKKSCNIINAEELDISGKSRESSSNTSKKSGSKSTSTEDEKSLKDKSKRSGGKEELEEAAKKPEESEKCCKSEKPESIKAERAEALKKAPIRSVSLPANQLNSLKRGNVLGSVKISTPVGILDLSNLSSDSSDSSQDPAKCGASIAKEYDNVCSQIKRRLFLGSDTIAQNKQLLKHHKITHILNCAGGYCDNYYPDDFTYMTLHLLDGKKENILCLFYIVLEFIDNAIRGKGRVYVHCQQGVSRSSAMLILYLMWSTHKNFADTHEFVKKLRKASSPNAGFISQLMAWWNSHTTPFTEPKLYQVAPHGPATPDLYALYSQPLSLASLDQRGCFIVRDLAVIYVWVGRECPEFLVNHGVQYGNRLKRFERAEGEIVTILQGQEPEEFKALFNGEMGKVEISNQPSYDERYKLMHVSSPSRKKKVVEDTEEERSASTSESIAGVKKRKKPRRGSNEKSLKKFSSAKMNRRHSMKDKDKDKF